MESFWSIARPVIERYADEDKTGQLHEDVRDVDEWLKYLLEGCDRIDRLVKSLKTYSKQSDTPKEPHALILIINDTLYLVGHKLKMRGIKIDVTVPAELMIYGDSQKISQVFINLINNASEAMKDEGGVITIHAAPANGLVTIKVRDNGPGIPEDIASKIFDPFFTTKGKDSGTGLGLFIVRTIIEEHQGKISLSPFDGKGAEFSIILPQGEKGM
jgi:signal transduction histidine kinase